VRERLRTGFEKIDRVWSEVTNILADTIPGIRVVKAFAQEHREAQRLAQPLKCKREFASEPKVHRLFL
jgi:ATP-binding cassette subfamily B protein